MGNKTAIVFGASGLIGNLVVNELLKNNAFDAVKAVYRKASSLSHPKLRSIVADYRSIDQQAAELRADVVFSCLGTTKQKTPDKKAYYEADHDYPVKVASILKLMGAKQFHLVSSIGADVKSTVFYLRMKGETERDLEILGIESLYIYRPGLLVGERKEKRTMEAFFTGLMAVLNPLLVGSLKKYRSIQAQTVAKGMVKQALSGQRGTLIFESEAIKQLL